MRAPKITLALALLFACSERSPRGVLDDYRRALEKGDLDRAASLSDAPFREAYAKKTRTIAPDERKIALDRIARAKGEGASSCDFDLGGGERIRLIKEADGWRIASGALEIGRFETPEAALQSFFFGVETRSWGVVRGAMPKRHRDGFASDEALAVHIDSIKARIDRAKGALGDLSSAHASIKGEKAEIAYGEGRRVTFEREDGAWRIIDLE